MIVCYFVIMDLASRYQALSSLPDCQAFKVMGGEEWAFYRKNMGLAMCWPGFPTHFTSRRRSDGSASQYAKPAGNTMLRTNHYARNEVVKSMKNYFLPLCHEVRRFVSLTPHKDYSVTLEIGVPRNWDTVRRVRGKISWKPPEPGYKPRWDLDNWFLYHKVMQDVLSEMSIIPDDTIDIFTANHRVYKEVPTLADRYLLLLIQNREHEKSSP